MLTVDEAIRIAKIIEYCPESRLPLIVAVFNQADINIASLECVNEDKVEHIIEGIPEAFPDYRTEDGLYKIPTTEFNSYCIRNDARPNLVRADLARAGILQASRDGRKRNFTVSVWKDGKTIRCVVLRLD